MRADGALLSRTSLRTAGPPAKLSLSADRTTIRHAPTDLAYVTVTVTDAGGEAVPEAGRLQPTQP